MLNKPNSRSEYIIQDGVTPYPIGFKFFFNGDNTPQVRVKIGDMVAVQNLHYKFSEDLSTLILIPLEEEKPADPNDYSWLNKWVGKELVIERDIEFVNESDYHVGRIAPEQIEKDFDLSVMRDQVLQQQITGNDIDIETLFDTVAEHREDIDGIFVHQDEQDGRLTDLENSKVDKDQGKVNVGKVMTVEGDGIVRPRVSQGGGGIGGVIAHDDTLFGAGTDEYPLGVKNKTTITIVDWE